MNLTREAIFYWGAIAAVATAFFSFALLFVSALNEGADNYATEMGR